MFVCLCVTVFLFSATWLLTQPLHQEFNYNYFYFCHHHHFLCSGCCCLACILVMRHTHILSHTHICVCIYIYIYIYCGNYFVPLLAFQDVPEFFVYFLSHLMNELCQLFYMRWYLTLTLRPWSWTFTVQHTIYVKCEYFMNQEV